MRMRQAVGGIVFLVLAFLLAAQALGPYLALAQSSSTYTLPVFLLAIAAILAAAGMFLLQAARRSGADGLAGMAASLEDPQHPPPVRSPLLPVTSGGNPYAGPGGGVSPDTRQPSERDRDEPD